jgi:predicted ATPase
MYGGHDPGVCGKGQGALALWALGYPDQALQSSCESVALAEKLGHLPSFLHSLWFAGVLHLLRRDIAAARDCGARVLALGQENGLAQYKAVGGTYHYWALTQLGGGEKALEEMRSYLQRWRTTARLMLDVFGVGLAELELHFGHLEEAAVSLTEAENAGTGWWQSDVLRVRGDLQRLRSGKGDRSPEQLYIEAILVAQDQQARSFELRAAASLARLWRDQGKGAKARDLLGPVFGWFTEGFDTPDLKEARALLAELM